jgi:hypothetical protein
MQRWMWLIVGLAFLGLGIGRFQSRSLERETERFRQTSLTLVLDQAEHSIFMDRKLAGERRPRNPEHLRAIEAISTAFWDAYLRDDPAAKAWLQSEQVRAVLAEPDQWQRK